MNKTVLYVVAALVGIGAAVALFGLSGPSEDSERGADVAEVRSESSDEEDQPRKKPAKKVKDAKSNPFAAEAAKNLASDWGQFCLSAAPAWTNVGMELGNDGKTELAAEARKEASRLRKERRKSDVDTAPILAEQKALLDRIEAAGPNEAAAGSIANIRGLMESLQAAEAAGDGEEKPAE